MTNSTPRMVHRLTLFVLVASLLFTAGCLEGSAQRTGIFLPPKPANAPIDVFIDTTPAVSYAEVGLVSAEGTSWSADFDALIRVMQDQARQLGADAVILTDSWTEEDIWYDEYGYEHYQTRMVATGIAIYYQ